VALEEFLVPAELETINQFALDNEQNFQISQVVTPGETAGKVDFQSRRSRVLTDLGNLGEMFQERVRLVLPLIGQRLGINTRNTNQIDVQMTASNDQDFFIAHIDNGPAFPTRAISYVYFFNREPAGFTGGELLLFDSDATTGNEGTPSHFTTIMPAQNQIVFFPSSLRHEVRPLSVPSKAFQDSRFTVNGWIHT
jgi:SM-20-related protein